MPDPLRSPKQSRVAARNRSHPYVRPANVHRARDAGLSRSNSIVGAIKSLVTAPLAWFSLGGSQDSNDSPQKRRVSSSERGGTPPRAKRVRRGSLEVVGHLDPPGSLFPTSRPPIPRWDPVNGATPVRTMSLDLPPLSSDHAATSQPPSRQHSVLSRSSVSVEPPSRSAVGRSATRDLSMPPPSPFARSYSRSSLTPQPSGATFGPSPKRKPRESTAPPLLSSPVPASKPTFARQPTSSVGQQGGLFPRSLSRGMSEEGSISVLLGRSRQSISPVREKPSRSLLVSNDEPITRSSSNSTVERTLSALESYRTPLHASHFPSTPLADTRRPRKVHVPVPSKLRFDHTPEGQKEKMKRGSSIIGPYSPEMSGMRKLLARRREELEKEAEIARHAGPDKLRETETTAEEDHTEGKTKTKEDEAEQGEPQKVLQLNGINVKTDAQPLRSRSPPRSKPDGPFSLRVSSNKLSRTHASAPKLKQPKNKFSLDDDDEMELNMSVEDVKKYQAAQTQLQIPFSPTRSMSETGMQTDTDNTSLLRQKTPPLPSQPQTFDSLLSRIGPPESIPPKPASFPTVPASPLESGSQAQKEPKAIPTSETSSVPAALPFSLGVTASVPKHIESGTNLFALNMATPEPSPSPAPGPPTSSAGGVPSFFANTKTQFKLPKVPSSSLFGGTLSGADKIDVPQQSNDTLGGFGAAKKDHGLERKELQSEAKLSPFGGASKPSTFGGASSSTFSDDSSKLEGASNNAPTATPSPFSGFGTSTPTDGAPKPVFSLGTPSATSPSISILGAANKAGAAPPSATDMSSERVSFPAASSFTQTGEQSNTKPEATASSKGGFSLDERSSKSSAVMDASKPPFSFGAPPSSTQSPNTAQEAASSPFSFGAAPSTPPPVDKKSSFAFGNALSGSSPGFSFGSNASALNRPTTEASKATFVGFGTSTTTDPNPTSVQAEGGDGMELNGGDKMEESPTRTAEKKDDPTQRLPQVSPFGGFGSGASSSGGFSFGQNKSATSAGIYSFGEPKPSSGTGFSFGVPSKSGANPTTSFTFGQSANKPASTTLSPGILFGTDASKTSVQSQSFGAPLNNPFGGASPSGPSSAAKGFLFGQPSAEASANVFGQLQQSENGISTITNSSTFPQQTSQSSQPQSPSFSFNVPTFSPPTGAGSSLSTTTQPFQFGASSSTQQPAVASGNTMFTLGGAATPPRKVKGLPTRRARRP